MSSTARRRPRRRYSSVTRGGILKRHGSRHHPAPAHPSQFHLPRLSGFARRAQGVAGGDGLPGVGLGVSGLSRRFESARPGHLPAQRRPRRSVCADRKPPLRSAPYEGDADLKHPLPEGPKRPVSVTWYEYLRPLECKKPIRKLVRERIWDQRNVFQAVRKRGAADLKEAELPPELDFLDFICSRQKANWIHHFRDLSGPQDSV